MTDSIKISSRSPKPGNTSQPSPAQEQAQTPPANSTAAKRKIPKPPDRAIYQALGCVEGILYISGSNQINLEIKDGQTLKISQIRDQKLLIWLLTNVEHWQNQPIVWSLYPNRGGFTLAWANLSGRTAVPVGRFLISGHCETIAEGKIRVKVGRNDPTDKRFIVAEVAGHLPNLVEGSLWRIEAVLENERLTLIDAEEWEDDT